MLAAVAVLLYHQHVLNVVLLLFYSFLVLAHTIFVFLQTLWMNALVFGIKSFTSYMFFISFGENRNDKTSHKIDYVVYHRF